ncbi:MAG: hypothetical protein DSY83_05350, partial [Flavobacteriia bacterium]
SANVKVTPEHIAPRDVVGNVPLGELREHPQTALRRGQCITLRIGDTGDTIPFIRMVQPIEVFNNLNFMLSDIGDDIGIDLTLFGIESKILINYLYMNVFIIKGFQKIVHGIHF